MCSKASPSFSLCKRTYSKKKACPFKLLKCSRQELCLICFLVLNLSLVHCSKDSHAESENSNIQCASDVCHLKISSNEQALRKMSGAQHQLFHKYATEENGIDVIDGHGVEKFMTEVGLIKDPHAGHDHGHDHAHMSKDDFDISKFADFFYDYDYGNDEELANSTANQTHTRKRRSEDELPCITSVEELLQSYFSPSDDIQLTLGDFTTLLPQILFDLGRTECGIMKEDEHGSHDKDLKVEDTKTNIWLISFGCVFLISIVSFLGVLMIPLLQHQKILNITIAFLVALSSGTLSGDALLHLLPHSSGLHDHSGGGHDHGGHDHSGHGHGHGEGDDDHFNMLWKGLVACIGIYVFYVMEAVMGIIRRKRASKSTEHHHEHGKCDEESPAASFEGRNNRQDNGVAEYSPTESPLLNVGVVDVKSEPTICNSQSSVPLIRPVGATGHSSKHGNEPVIETGHHHHVHKVPKTIANLAWMIIVGDGLHNLTDGLAIGVAFTSSIGTGLGTSLAVFCHELPQELGDFAILLDSGMTVKQALICNFLSATTCFLGLLIGLLVGEYTSGVILWILAFTAGGFLYISLVGMLPAMMKQLESPDYLKRFLIQNIGMLCGFAIMVVIGLREESFNNVF